MRQRPDIIIIYREGLTEKQAEDQLKISEIPAVKNMIKKVGKATKCEDYDP